MQLIFTESGERVAFLHAEVFSLCILQLMEVVGLPANAESSCTSNTYLTLILQQADLKCQLGDAGYVVFGVILFVWELLPTSLVVFFFRVRNPTKDLVSYIFPAFNICPLLDIVFLKGNVSHVIAMSHVPSKI